MIDTKKIVEFARDELMISKNVIVNVYLEDLTEDNAHGWCVASSDKPGFNKNEYDIELEETLNDDELLVTLCHEMVHVRQYSQGERSNEREAISLENELAEKYLLIVSDF
jgi:hypothetical protein